MSAKYCIESGEFSLPTTTDFMRILCQRPGKTDEFGKILYTTEQSHKDQCNINKIIRKYDNTGIISHVSKIEGKYGDMTGLELKSAMDMVIDAKNMFDKLPSEIRKRFRNSPEELIEFMEHPENREEAIELGLIDKNWTEETDGLGEHVLEGGNEKDEEPI